MAIKISNQTVISDARQLQNIVSLDTTTTNTVSALISSVALDQSANLSDLASVETARENLDVYSKAEVLAIAEDEALVNSIIFGG